VTQLPSGISSARAKEAIQPVPILVVQTDYISRAAALPGRTILVVLALLWLASLRRSPTVVLSRWALTQFHISPDAGFDALDRLSVSKMIRTDRCRGRYPRVTLLDAEGNALVIATP